MRVAALHGPSLPSRETVAGFEVFRIALWSSILPRGVIAGTVRRIEVLLRIALGHRGFDVLHCHDLESLPIGVVMKLMSFLSARLIYDAHEYESHQSPGQSARRTRFLQAIECTPFGGVDRIITVTPSIAREHVRLYHVSEPAIVLNCPPLQSPARESRFHDLLCIAPSQSICLYQGLLAVGRAAFCGIRPCPLVNSSDSWRPPTLVSA